MSFKKYCIFLLLFFYYNSLFSQNNNYNYEYNCQNSEENIYFNNKSIDLCLVKSRVIYAKTLAQDNQLKELIENVSLNYNYKLKRENYELFFTGILNINSDKKLSKKYIQFPYLIKDYIIKIFEDENLIEDIIKASNIYTENLDKLEEFLKNKDNSAIQKYEELISFNYFLNGLYFYITSEDFNNAKDNFYKSLINYNNNYFSNKYLAIINIKFEKFSEAKSNILISSSYSSNYHTLYLSALINFKLENIQLAYNEIKSSLGENLFYFPSQVLLIDILIRNRDFKSAIKEANFYLDISPKNIELIIKLCEIYLLTNELEFSKKIIEPLIEKGVIDSKVLEIYADILLKEDNREKACEYYNLAIKNSIKSNTILQNKYYKCKDQNYESQIENLPSHSNLVLKGQVKKDNSEDDLTIFKFSDTSEKNLFKYSAINEIKEYQAQKEILKDYKDNFENNNDLINKYLINAIEFIKKNKFYIANLELKKAYILDNNCQEINYLLGLVNFYTEYYQESVLYFKKAIVDFGYNDFKFNEYISSANYSNNTYILLALSYERLKDFPNYNGIILKAAKKYAEIPEINYLAGKSCADLYYKSKDHEKIQEAIYYLDKAINLGSIDAKKLLKKIKK